MTRSLPGTERAAAVSKEQGRSRPRLAEGAVAAGPLLKILGDCGLAASSASVTTLSAAALRKGGKDGGAVEVDDD